MGQKEEVSKETLDEWIEDDWKLFAASTDANNTPLRWEVNHKNGHRIRYLDPEMSPFLEVVFKDTCPYRTLDTWNDLLFRKREDVIKKI